MDASTLRAHAQEAPFALYGLTDEFRAPRTLGAVGLKGGVGLGGYVVELVSLCHGDRWVAPYVWVQVTVTGPLHGDDWSSDPRPMIAGELLNAAGAEFSTSDAFEQAVQQVVERSFADVQIKVDSRPESFRAWFEGDHWAALRDLGPDHLLYVIASNVAPSAIGLRRIDDDALRLYASPDE